MTDVMTLDSARANQWTGIGLFLLGASMLVGGFTMDRLEIRQIHPASIPGLVPMILGVVMMICAALLTLGARQQSVSTTGATQQFQGPVGSLKSLAFTAGYSVAYALILVGLLPFWFATAIYISVFYIHFSWQLDTSLPCRMKRVGLGVAFGIVGALAISTLFEHGFLVRLP